MATADTHSQATSRSAALAAIYQRLLLAAAEREARRRDLPTQAAQPAGSGSGAAPRPAGAAGRGGRP